MGCPCCCHLLDDLPLLLSSDAVSRELERPFVVVVMSVLVGTMRSTINNVDEREGTSSSIVERFYIFSRVVSEGEIVRRRGRHSSRQSIHPGKVFFFFSCHEALLTLLSAERFLQKFCIVCWALFLWIRRKKKKERSFS
jgi:hypothetical protein